MTRSKKMFVGLALSALMVFATAATAFGVPVLSLSATRGVVTYPQPTWLKVAATEGGAHAATMVTVQYRPIGTTEWKQLRTLTASQTAEGTVTVPVSPYRLKVITAFRAIAAGAESDVTTVSVKARLSRAITPRSVRAGHRVTVKGFIWPKHAAGSRPVTVTFWKWEGGDWVERGVRHPKIVRTYGDSAKWQFRVKTTSADKGKWRIRVSHEDTQHIASMSRYSYIKVR